MVTKTRLSGCSACAGWESKTGCIACGGTGMSVQYYEEPDRKIISDPPYPPQPPVTAEELEDTLGALLSVGAGFAVFFYGLTVDSELWLSWLIGGILSAAISGWLLKKPFRFVLVILRWLLTLVAILALIGLAAIVIHLLSGGTFNL